MRLKTPLLAALVLCVLAVPTWGEGTLGSTDLRKLAPGRYAVNVMGLVSMTVMLRPNGIITGVTSKGKQDTGVWSVKGNSFCVAWNRWLGAKRRCTTLSGSGGTYFGGGLWLRRI